MPEPSASAPPLPAVVSRRIDLICDDFERLWEEGTPRSIEDYLKAADTSWISPLCDELIQLELELRCRRGDTPLPEEYQTRFPECAVSIHDWLREAQTAANLLSTAEHLGGVSTKDLETGIQPTDAPPTAAAGTLPRYLGEYEVLERLGAGGMGEVYRAKHRRLGKLVALKVLPAARMGDAALARFHREMEAVGQLDHPHLAEAHDAGEQDGIVFLVLKLIDGIDLHRLVKENGPLPVDEACDLVRQAALGLQYLHKRGLIHRDIKPSNLMRTQEGIVKVLDLGLARWQTAPGPDDLTSPNQAMGTPDYMAPEQINNAAGVDIRADLYSLGATLFCLLAGRAPFAHHRDTLAKMNAHGYETPADVRSLRPEVPAEVAAIVARLLAKQPGQRFATPQAVAAVLTPFCAPAKATSTKGSIIGAASVPVTPGTTILPAPFWPRPLRLRRRRQVVVLLTGLAVLVAVAVGWAALATLSHPRYSGSGTTDQGQPSIPGPEQPLPAPAVAPVKVLRLDVQHFAKQGMLDAPRGLLGRKSFGTHCDDAVSVSSKLSAPAYCYLIAFRPDGTEEVCFPEKENEAPPLTDEPRYPSVSMGVLYGLNEGPGLHAFVLVISAKPLPSYAEWRKQRGMSPWRKSDAQGGVVWRLGAGAPLAYTSNDPDGTRGKGQELGSLGPLPRLMQWLLGGAEVEVEAVAFAVQRRE